MLPGEDPHHETWVSFLTAFRAVSRARYSELYRAGFHKLHAGLLHLLHSNGGSMTVSEIADIMCLADHSVTGLANRAEKLGLVRKIDDTDDRRLVHIAITEEGEQEYQRSLKHRQTIRRVMGALTAEELKQFAHYLNIIRERALAEEKAKEGKSRR